MTGEHRLVQVSYGHVNEAMKLAQFGGQTAPNPSSLTFTCVKRLVVCPAVL